MKATKWAAVALAVIATAGCNESKPQNPVDFEARAEIERLKREVAGLKLEAALARIDTSGLGADVAVFETQGTKAYTKLKAPSGVVLASLERVEPYLNGYNVFINVGNPSTAHLHGVTGELKWGKAQDGAELQTVKFELLDSFPPGTWRVIKLTTGNADAQSIGKVVFAPVFNQLSLARN